MSKKSELERARLLKEGLYKLLRACNLLDKIEKRLDRQMDERKAA